MPSSTSRFGSSTGSCRPVPRSVLVWRAAQVASHFLLRPIPQRRAPNRLDRLSCQVRLVMARMKQLTSGAG
jgi:hypothetical protein